MRSSLYCLWKYCARSGNAKWTSSRWTSSDEEESGWWIALRSQQQQPKAKRLTDAIDDCITRIIIDEFSWQLLYHETKCFSCSSPTRVLPSSLRRAYDNICNLNIDQLVLRFAAICIRRNNLWFQFYFRSPIDGLPIAQCKLITFLLLLFGFIVSFVSIPWW